MLNVKCVIGSSIVYILFVNIKYTLYTNYTMESYNQTVLFHTRIAMNMCLFAVCICIHIRKARIRYDYRKGLDCKPYPIEWPPEKWYKIKLNTNIVFAVCLCVVAVWRKHESIWEHNWDPTAHPFLFASYSQSHTNTPYTIWYFLLYAYSKLKEFWN